MTDYDIETPTGDIKVVGSIQHPRHGDYVIWSDGDRFALTRPDVEHPPTICAYASVGALFHARGL